MSITQGDWEMSINEYDLQVCVGSPIDRICSNHYSSPTEASHCAHFVSHVLGIRLGLLCGDMTWKTRSTGVSIRCNELYNNLQCRGPRGQLHSCYPNATLIFVTSAKNVPNGVMKDGPLKHVGIYMNGRVYNYSNTQQQVVMDSSVEAFHKKFKYTYRGDGDDISLYYGVAP